MDIINIQYMLSRTLNTLNFRVGFAQAVLWEVWEAYDKRAYISLLLTLLLSY